MKVKLQDINVIKNKVLTRIGKRVSALLWGGLIMGVCEYESKWVSANVSACVND